MNSSFRITRRSQVMERQLWKAIVVVLGRLDKGPRSTRQEFADVRIVQVFFWAVIHDRSQGWACRRAHWPIDLQKRPLPSPSTMSRRLRSPSVRALLEALDRCVLAPQAGEIFWMIDGKPLVIGGCSKDRHAGYGRAAGGKAKGYKIHALVGSCGGLAAWLLAPMNKDERTMAKRLVRRAPVQGYVVGDANYDSNPLHEVCVKQGELQLVTPRRYGKGKGLGHIRHSRGRQRSIALLENPQPRFGEQLLKDRVEIERRFGCWCNWGGSLTCLPAWARTHPRVRRWVQAKLVLAALKRRIGQRTCVA
jgi:Transposase DDE domain